MPAGGRGGMTGRAVEDEVLAADRFRAVFLIEVWLP
jgi:hypothetical protein